MCQNSLAMACACLSRPICLQRELTVQCTAAQYQCFDRMGTFMWNVCLTQYFVQKWHLRLVDHPNTCPFPKLHFDFVSSREKKP